MAEFDPLATQRDAAAGIVPELEAEGFENAQVVGRGGFGTVYRLDQPNLNRTVAIKVLRSDVDRENRERFLREQRAMGAVSEHPNIVSVFHAGVTATGHPYLVMPYHSRGSLDARIRGDGPLDWRAAVSIGVRLAGALEVAHGAGILHRDIKPSNVLLTDYGEPALTDFGIARIEGGFETSENIITGSPAFTAPELLHGQTPTAASDVYALGATLFCLVTGHAAFERRSGESVVAQFLRVARQPVPDLRCEDVPDDLCAAIEHAMEQDPADRPRSAVEFGDELRLVQRRHSLTIDDMALPGGQGRGDARRSRLSPPTPRTRYRPPTAVRPLVDRTRLSGLLRAGRGRRLIVIHGPAGFGKSTLAAQWRKQLSADGIAVAWLAVDHDDNNVVWFLAHLIEAIRQVRPTLAEELVRVLEEHGNDVERFVLASLIDEIHEGGERMAIVIDDWHRVTDNAAVAAVEYLIDNGCHHLQLIVTSRNKSGLPMSRTRVRDELVEIDSTDLRFDLAESTEFLVQLSGLALENAQVASIVRSTDGWVAALQLVSLSLRGSDDLATFVEKLSGRHRGVGDYLVENVLDSLEPRTLNFLLSISVPERICGGLASALIRSEHGRAMLEDVENRDLFLYRVDDDGEWCRFSSVFAEFLRARLERDQPERTRELHRIASRWFADHDLLSEAVDHALAASEIDDAVELVETHGMFLVTHGQLVTLLGLVAKLPRDVILARPRLQIAVAWADVSLHRSASAQKALDRAEACLAQKPLPTTHSDLVLESDLVRAVLDVTADRIDRVGDLVSGCLVEPDAVNPWVVSVAANLASFVRICRFEFDAARNLQDWAADYHRRSTGPFSAVYGHCYAGLAANEQLDVVAAEESYRQALRIARKSMGIHSHAARMASALLGELMYEQNRLDEAEGLLDEGRALGSEIGLVDFMIAIYATGCRVKVMAGDMDSATTLLNEGDRIARTMSLPRLSARIDDERSRLGLPVPSVARERPGRQAGGVSLTPVKNDQGPSTGIEAITVQLTESGAIRRLLAERSPGQADAACTRAYGLVHAVAAQNRPRALMQARLLLTACLSASGREAEAMEELVPLAAKCAELNLLRLVCDAGPLVVAVASRLLEEQLAGRWRAEWPAVPPGFLNAVGTAT